MTLQKELILTIIRDKFLEITFKAGEGKMTSVHEAANMIYDALTKELDIYVLTPNKIVKLEDEKCNKN